MPNLIDDREDRECNACEQQAVLGGRRASLVGGKVCKQGVKRNSYTHVPLSGALTLQALLVSLVL